MSKKNLLIVTGIIIFIGIAVIMFLLINNKKVVTYNVSFETDGGTTISSLIVNEGEKVNKPSDPIKDGFVFVEWQLNGSTYDFSLEVTSNLVLTANWIKLNENGETFVVKFETDGGTTISNQIVKKDDVVQKPIDPVKKGYQFKGWFLNDKIYDFKTIVESDIELKAKWEEIKENTNNKPNNGSSNDENNNKPSTPTTPSKKEYTIIFNSNDGSAVSSQKIIDGGKVVKPDDPTRDGYIFDGWLLNGSVYNFDTKVSSNITLVANWKKKNNVQYTVSFNSNGGSAVSSQTIIEGGKVVKPDNPIRTGYKFNGWELNGNLYDFSSTVNGNITLNAKWKQNSYSVVANKIDNTSSFSRILSVYENDKLITVKEIQYSDGIKICSGSNPNVNYYAIEGETTLKLVLSDGTIVTASLTIA